MRRLVSILVLLLLNLNVNAQSKLKVRGTVADATTHKHLQDVVIIVPNSTTGTFSDEKGVFEIDLDSSIKVLVFSKVGYERQTISISKNNLNLKIELQRKSIQLKEATVTADAAKPITKNKGLGLVDYDFWNDDTLLIIGCRNNNPAKSKLYMISEYGDTISSIAIPEKPISLFTDCINNHYIICDLNFYEIYFEDKELEIFDAESSDKFRNVQQPCVAAIDTMIIYSIVKGAAKETIGEFNYTTNNYLQVYVSYNRLNGRYRQFATIADRKLIRQLFEEKRRVDENYNNGLYRSAFDAQIDFMFAHKVMYKAVYAPLFKIDTLLYIFNFPESMIQTYTATPDHVNNVPLQFGDEKEFKRAIYQDRKNQKVYAYYLNNGVGELRLIDIATGELKMTYTIKKLFAENIRVRNNYIYFLDKDEGTDDVRVLYKQSIE